jgi:hypothetical protein
MQNKLSDLVALSVLALGSALALSLGGCAQEQNALDKPSGTYEKTVTSTDASGTTTQKQSSTVVSEDSDGNKKAVIKSKTTQDPKGLLNKTTTSQSKQVIEENQ